MLRNPRKAATRTFCDRVVKSRLGLWLGTTPTVVLRRGMDGSTSGTIIKTKGVNTEEIIGRRGRDDDADSCQEAPNPPELHISGPPGYLSGLGTNGYIEATRLIR